MSSFGTKKPGADLAVQMTFPHVFSEEVSPGAMGYYPEASGRNEVIYPSHDLQGIWHQQKMEDAHRRALHAVRDTAMSKARWLHSHAGYFNMPRPVLSQRQYANPSNGNQADIYNNRNVSFNMPPSVWSEYRPEGLRGGVLYTAEAQKWGRQKLRERIAQFDAIKANKEGFVEGLPVQETTTGELPEELGSKVKLEIVQTLRNIFSAVQAGKADSFAYGDLLKFMRLLFRWASTADKDDLEEVLEYSEEIETQLLGIEQEAEREGLEDGEVWAKKIGSNFNVMLQDFQKIREYLTKMIGAVNRSPKERKTLSATLVKSIGFTNLGKESRLTAEQKASRNANILRAEAIRDRADPPIPYDDVESFSAPSSWSSYQPRSRPESEIYRAMRQHVEEADREYRNARFDPSVRERMGRNNGTFFGEEAEIAEPSLRNPFRSGDGEAQAQGLEEAHDSDAEDEAILARSVAPVVPKRRKPTVARPPIIIEPSPSEAEATAAAAAEAPEEDLRARLAEPDEAQARRARVQEAYAQRQARLAEARAKVRNGTARPEDVRGFGREAFPYDTDVIRRLAQNWKDAGLGTYVPREGTTRGSALNHLFKVYHL